MRNSHIDCALRITDLSPSQSVYLEKMRSKCISEQTFSVCVCVHRETMLKCLVISSK